MFAMPTPPASIDPQRLRAAAGDAAARRIRNVTSDDPAEDVDLAALWREAEALMGAPRATLH